MQLLYFYRPLRVMLGDFDPDARQYPDEVLRDAVKTAVQLNKLPGYTLSVDEAAVEPEFRDANQFALLTYHTAKLFVQAMPDRFSFRTRAYSESAGSMLRFLTTLEAEIDAIENGTRFEGYQNYYSWLHGMAGLPLGEILAGFDVQAPLWKATFTRDGMRVA
jgi:hypothetical protein